MPRVHLVGIPPELPIKSIRPYLGFTREVLLEESLPLRELSD